MTGPFRDAPPRLACPRCGESLEQLASGVEVCSRCEGVWLPAIAVERAFGTPYWPQGANAWWRRELECPACALENRGTIMAAILIDNMVVDRCQEHGEWLDAGELGRLLDAPRVIELEAFYERLAPDAELPARLVEFRKTREDERARRLSELETYRLAHDAREARVRAEHEAARASERARAVQLVADERRALIAKQRAVIAEELRVIEGQSRPRERELVAKRQAIEARERELAAEHASLRKQETELADSRGRMIELERQLADLDAELKHFE